MTTATATETEPQPGTRRMRAVSEDLAFALAQQDPEERLRLLGSGCNALQAILNTWEDARNRTFLEVEGSHGHLARLAGCSRPLVGKVVRKLVGPRRVPKPQE